MDGLDLTKIKISKRGQTVDPAKIEKGYYSAILPDGMPRAEAREALEAAHPDCSFNLRGGVFPTPKPAGPVRAFRKIPAYQSPQRKKAGAKNLSPKQETA